MALAILFNNKTVMDSYIRRTRGKYVPSYYSFVWRQNKWQYVESEFFIHKTINKSGHGRINNEKQVVDKTQDVNPERLPWSRWILKCTISNTFVIVCIIDVPNNSWSMAYIKYQDDSHQNFGKSLFSVDAGYFFLCLKFDVRGKFDRRVNFRIEVNK